MLVSQVWSLNVNSTSKIKDIDLVLRLVESDQYEERIRPQFPREPTVVTLGFSVLTIEDLQIENMGFSMEIFLMQEWNDPRLRHNHPPHLDGSNFVDKIWMPDTYFRESQVVKRRQFEEKKFLLRIYPSGNVYYSTKASLRLSCAMDLKMFPMDVQHCFLTIESYGYNSSELIYQWQNRSKWVYTFKNKSLSHYDVDPMDISQSTSSYLYGEWSTLQVQITFKRKISAFIPAMYFPCTVIVFVSWITFFIHPDHFPARTNLCAISVLTMLTLQGSLNNSLPKVSYVKVIDTYVMGCVLFVSGAFAEYALVLLLKHRKQRVTKKRERKRRAKMKVTGATDLYKENPKEKVIQKVKNNAWSKFYMKETWPLILDEHSRLFFPFAFVVFNVVYWVTTVKSSQILERV